MARQGRASLAVRIARGENLLRAREANGFTLTALGTKVGVSAEQIRKYQIGQDFLSATWCWRIAKALGCSFGELFDVELDGGVAETAMTFTTEDDERLDEVLNLARSRLTGRRRADLRDILLDVLEDQDRDGT